MILLKRRVHLEPLNNFPVTRLRVEGIFEPIPGTPTYSAAFGNAIVDTGSPYVIIPYVVHRPGLTIYQDLGRQPYRISGVASQQPFAEVGLRFLITRPVLAYHPPHFVRVKADLLEPNVPPSQVVIGLDVLEQYFTLYVPPPPKDAFLLEPGDPIP